MCYTSLNFVIKVATYILIL